jgi:hypothetical protein
VFLGEKNFPRQESPAAHPLLLLAEISVLVASLGLLWDVAELRHRSADWFSMTAVRRITFQVPAAAMATMFVATALGSFFVGVGALWRATTYGVLLYGLLELVRLAIVTGLGIVNAAGGIVPLYDTTQSETAYLGFDARFWLQIVFLVCWPMILSIVLIVVLPVLITIRAGARSPRKHMAECPDQ